MTELTAGLKKQVGRSAPNLLTISRVVLACGVNSYLRSHFGEIGIPLFMFGLIFFTDYLDGKIARLAGTASSFGAVLDLTPTSFLSACHMRYYIHSGWFPSGLSPLFSANSSNFSLLPST